MAAAFGIGGGVSLLAIMAAIVPVSALIPVHGLVQLGSNAGRTWRTRGFLQSNLLIPFLIGAILGAVLGGLIVVELPEKLLKIALGVFILFVIWVKLPKTLSASKSVLSIGGFVTSVLTMFLGATGPFVVAMMANALDERKAVVANSAAMMTMQHGLKVIVFGLLGFAFGDWLALIIAMIATGYLGTITGVWMLGQINEELFRKIFKVGVTVLALDMIRRGLTL